MIPNFQKSGLLPQGVHYASWKEIVEKLGFNAHRRKLLKGLKEGLNLLFDYGCREIYINGSFTTAELFPNDIDVCFDTKNIKWEKFKREQPEFVDRRKAAKILKEKYHCDFFPYDAFEDFYVHFFQFDRNKNIKGIVKLYLTERFL